MVASWAASIYGGRCHQRRGVPTSPFTAAGTLLGFCASWSPSDPAAALMAKTPNPRTRRGPPMFEHTTEGVKIALAALVLLLGVLGATLGTVVVHGIGM